MLQRLRSRIEKALTGPADPDSRLKAAYGRLQTELVHQRSLVATAVFTEQSLAAQVGKSADATSSWDKHVASAKGKGNSEFVAQIVKGQAAHNADARDLEGRLQDSKNALVVAQQQLAELEGLVHHMYVIVQLLQAVDGCGLHCQESVQYKEKATELCGRLTQSNRNPVKQFELRASTASANADAHSKLAASVKPQLEQLESQILDLYQRMFQDDFFQSHPLAVRQTMDRLTNATEQLQSEINTYREHSTVWQHRAQVAREQQNTNLEWISNQRSEHYKKACSAFENAQSIISSARTVVKSKIDSGKHT